MEYKRKLHWLVFVLMTLFLFKGCGDLEQDMQDTRTVILNMDFHGKSSSRSSSSISDSDLNQYNTHLILAVHSRESLTDNYTTHYDSSDLKAKGLMDYSVNRNVSLEIPLYEHVKIFAFLFRDNPNWDDLDSGTPTAGYYGESQSSFSIEPQRNHYPVIITLQGTGNNTGNGNTTTAQAIEEVTPVTTPTSNSSPYYTFASTMAGSITYGGSCTSSITTAIVGNNTITFNTLISRTYSDCTITVTDSSGNASNTLAITSFTVDIIDTTLLAHYAFEGNLYDNSSYNRNLTGSNITFSAADNQSNKSGRAALFNGTNTYASVGNFTLGDNFTVAFWTFPFSSDMSQWDSAFSTGDNTNDGRFQIDFNNENIRFCAGSCYISTTLNSVTWNHIVITKTDSTDTIQMYTDGLPCSGCSASSITTLWDKIKIGLNRSGGGYWNGYIDELKIYNRTFSSQEVRDLHDSY